MKAQEPITKVTQTIRREDGSECRIVVTEMYGAGLQSSIDVFVLRRESSEDSWALCSDRPHPNWKAMSREEYLRHGRSEMLQAVSHAEILNLTRMIGQPLSASPGGAVQCR